ncbi:MULTISPECIES: phosphate ABC transporter permease PstA [unclassified Wenzhouxiangella]|uniref:phosphate ABC transporter permease PstA n=1 Tax=unclassified Wenzhouxiangella TaxID=2613841 RepID=UPI000E32BD67|nr:MULTISPECIES: phosphate ABC transporter permease PstA [unclassified Wenzhouxiangella]RFF26317.1 phosphate ABC transporter permease PstA [Wenzhouxiangella sp. 15181]RFP67413.1 phosphate ABC transporter permease PstA [Wenzhouxiangella sp. 15190]
MKFREWFKSGDPWIWLIGGALSISVIMVVGLLLLIAVRGFAHFWPAELVETTVSAVDGSETVILGEQVESETLPAHRVRESGQLIDEETLVVTRHLFKVGNRDLTGRDFVWHLEPALGEWHYPEDAMMVERREWGNFYGYPLRLEENGQIVAEGENLWDELQARIERANELHARIQQIERYEIGRINSQLEEIRLEERGLDHRGVTGAEREAAMADLDARRSVLEEQYEELRAQRNDLQEQNERDVLHARTANGQKVAIKVGDIVMASKNNALSLAGKAGFYWHRITDFLTGYPREANTEGGIFPAIFGTVVMVLIMSVLVTPFGVLAAIYLREYARQGPILRMIRVSVYNLAGVPSIVFGVFGLGFFVYMLGGSIDELFFPERLPAPTFGTPGLFWASLTLALLTLPVVIVSTEEGLARIPRTVREGSLALGATKWETLWKVVVPLSAPAMMTGLILAVARAAGEVAPLMLVGVVKLAPSLPVDGEFPYVHLERKIMHLGFHIYDVGFQSPNVEAARPLVYATALTLVALILILNLSAIAIRNRLREKYRSESD